MGIISALSPALITKLLSRDYFGEDLWYVKEKNKSPYGACISFNLQVLPIDATAGQLEAVQNFNTASGAGNDDYAAFESIYAFNSSGQTALAAILVYTKHVAYPPIFNGIQNVQPQLSNDLRFTNLSNLSTEAGSKSTFFLIITQVSVLSDRCHILDVPKGNYVWAHLSFSNNATTLAKANAIMQDVFTDLPTKGKNYTFGNVFQPIPKSITSKSADTGGNVLGLNTSENIVCEYLCVLRSST